MPLSDTQLEYDRQRPSGFVTVSRLDNAFQTFREDAALDLRALAGDVIFAGSAFDGALPPVLRAVSLGGDVEVDASMEQLPSPVGQLDLLAVRDLVGGNVFLQQLDGDPSLLPSIQVPEVREVAEPDRDPVHAGDERLNRLVARDGAIRARQDNGRWRLQLAKPSLFEAGTDLRNLSVVIQNIESDDVSVFKAGRDIVQGAQRTETGEFLVTTNRTTRVKYEIAGPGSAQFIAGRRIALGTSKGIETIGNNNNRFLPDEGAGLLLMAGLGSEPEYDAFARTYLMESDRYTRDPGFLTGPGGRAESLDGSTLGAFLAEVGLAAAGDPLDTFRALEPREQRTVLARVFLNELRESGLDATTSGSEDFSRGFTAVETLFPDPDASGGISMLLSQVQTLDGGDIRMLVPGGSVNAGAASSDIIDKEAADLGIVAAIDGDVEVFVDEDLLINSTRAFALQGDLLVWSSNGSIDAGKGAKTVTSIPSPVSRIGTKGETIIEFPPAVEGSGLQGVNAFLFAPRGVVNAGDAGIRATGDLTIGATEVLGADNIDVGGISVGVPTGTVAPPPTVATRDDVASRTTREVTRQAVESGGGSQSAAASGALSIISVEVLGFGDG